MKIANWIAACAKINAMETMQIWSHVTMIGPSNRSSFSESKRMSGEPKH